MSIDHPTVSIDSEPRVRLRIIGEEDLEKLRQWKNDNRLRFFHQDEISSEQQRQWFEGFCAREDDFIMIVEADDEPVGCMGYRIEDDAIDVYNVIRGNPGGPPGTMQSALVALVAAATKRYPRKPVHVQVLTDNPAIGWYVKCGFALSHQATNHVVLTYRPNAPTGVAS